VDRFCHTLIFLFCFIILSKKVAAWTHVHAVFLNYRIAIAFYIHDRSNPSQIASPPLSAEYLS